MACIDVLKNYRDHLNTPVAHGLPSLKFCLVTNAQTLTASVYYVEGEMHDWNSPILGGAGQEYKAGDRWNTPQGLFDNPHLLPFDPSKTKAANVTVNLDTGNFTFNQLSFLGTCQAGVITGVYTPIGLFVPMVGSLSLHPSIFKDQVPS